MFNLFSLAENEIRADSKVLWTFRNSELLVIDDINPSDSSIHKLITPAVFLSMMGSTELNTMENRDLFCKNNSIWVLGMDWDNRHHWVDMLVNMGVNQQDISFIHLENTLL